MRDALRILHLENDPLDAELVEAALAKGGVGHEIRVAADRETYLEALGSERFDLILSDCGMPGFDGLSALRAARQECPDTPFIAVTDTPPEPLLRELEVSGVTNVVPKSGLDRLAPAIHRALHGGGSAASGLPGATLRLVEVVQELSLARDLPTVMAIVRHAARELTGADGATFVLREGDQCHYAEEDAIAPLWKGKRFPMSACISGWAMLNRQAAAIEDIYADPRIPADAYRPTFVKSLAMVPIRTKAPIGAIGNYWAARHAPTGEELSLLQALADSTSIAMENIELYQNLERRVADRTAQLETANKELESFSYSVSHDLRAPLRAIGGFAGLLLERASEGLDPKSKEYLGHIVASTENMHHLIEDLLKLAGVTRAPLRNERVDLSHLAEAAMARLRDADPGRRAHVDIARGLHAQGDPSLLRAALENLLGNAWKYTSKRPEARIAFGMEAHGDEQAFFVRDNGAGFDMAYAGRLFGAFQRLHADRDFPGTGVGLATVQRILHRHGGRIWAESEVDKGAAFYFTLP